MELVDDRLTAGQRDQPIAAAQTEHQAGGILELPPPLLLAPEPPQGLQIKPATGFLIAGTQSQRLEAGWFTVHGGQGGLSYIVATVMTGDDGKGG